MTFEVRAYISSIDKVIEKLKDLGAKFKSEYSFTDYIYTFKDNSEINLNNEFIRLREFEKSA